MTQLINLLLDNEAVRNAVIGLVLAVLGLLGAAVAWAVSWVRSHTAASAVRQAVQAHGDTMDAADAAVAELEQMPRLMRPRHLGAAVQQQRNRQRASKEPPA